MKKFFKRTLKVLGVLVLGLFLTAFVWANWEKPSPGEMASVVDFLQYDTQKVGDSAKIKSIQKTLSGIEGVRGSTFNPVSGLLVVSYGVADTDRELIEQTIQNAHRVELKEKIFEKSGPKCPIDVSYIVRVKRFLCVRD